MKRIAKTLSALLVSGAVSASALPVLPVSAAESASALPDWVPQSYEEVVEFLNRYGKTHVDDYICIVREFSPECSADEELQISGMKKEDLLSDQTYSVKAENPGKDDGSAEYAAKLRAYEHYQKLIKECSETEINQMPQYQVMTFLPSQTGTVSVEYTVTGYNFEEASDSDGNKSSMSNTMTYNVCYTFKKDKDGVTQTDIYGWLPDCIDEFQEFVRKNGVVSIQGQQVAVCTSVNPSTGASLIDGQTGAEFAEERSEQIPRVYNEPKHRITGGGSLGIKLYAPKEEGRTVFTQFVGRLFDDSPASVISTDILAEKDGSAWKLSLGEDAGSDLNADGKFDEDDLNVLRDHLTMVKPLTDAQMVMADYNGDKRVDARDLSCLKQRLLTAVNKPSGGKAGEINSPELFFDTPVYAEAPMDGGGWGVAPSKSSDVAGGWEGGGGSRSSASEPVTSKPSGSEEVCPYEPYKPEELAASHILTAGEWNDGENWEFFTKIVENGAVEFPSFGLDPIHRVEMKVTQNGEPLQNQEVTLYGEKTEWTAVTDRSGVAYLFYDSADAGKELSVRAGEKTLVRFTAPEDEKKEYEVPVPVDINNQQTNCPPQIRFGVSVPQLSFEAELEAENKDYTETEVMFILDTTGSMGDEIRFLQKDFASIAEAVGNEHITFSVNFYRDEGDEYVTKCNPFTDDVQEIGRLLDDERAMGGGDTPEAVHKILQDTIIQGNWHRNTNKIAFLIFDAPPHDGEKISKQCAEAIAAAAAQGIHLIPVVASNAERETELFARAAALMTNSNYVFLTDDSGVGYSHLEPIIGDYYVELLHDIIVRNILEIAGEPVPERKVIVRQQEQQEEQPVERIYVEPTESGKAIG